MRITVPEEYVLLAGIHGREGICAYRCSFKSFSFLSLRADHLCIRDTPNPFPIDHPHPMYVIPSSRLRRRSHRP